MKKSEIRNRVMTTLYQIEIYKSANLEKDIETLKKNRKAENDKFFTELLDGVCDHYDEINEKANKYLRKWNINRLDKAGASILRMGIYELMYMDTPTSVVINEAIELSKKYSNIEVKNMINAVLDKIAKE